MQNELISELDRLRQRVAELEAAQPQAPHQYEHLFRAVEQSPVSIVITDQQGTILYTNPRFFELTGFTPDEVIGQNPRIVKSSQTPIAVYDSMWSTILAGETWEGEFINKKKNGELYHEAARISAMYDTEGKITHFVAVKTDITARKQADAALERHDQEMAALYQNSLEINAQTNLDNLLNTIIERACALLKIEAGLLYLTDEDDEALEFLAGYHLPAGFSGEPIEIGKGALGRVLKSGRPVIIENYDPCSQDLPITADSAPQRMLGIPLKKGQKVIGALAMLDDASGSFSSEQVLLLELFADQATIAVENARMMDEINKAYGSLKTKMAVIEELQIKLREQSIRDPLTGLYNRRYLQETIEREMANSDRSRLPISMVMMDIDRFKRINDTYGHMAGDLVLVRFARVLRGQLRKSDILCRYGGEEFVVVMPGASLAKAFERAELIRQMFEKEPIQCNGEEIHVTVSAGVAVYPTHGHNGEEVLIKADRALYWAKESGRNQTVLFQI